MLIKVMFFWSLCTSGPPATKVTTPLSALPLISLYSWLILCTTTVVSDAAVRCRGGSLGLGRRQVYHWLGGVLRSSKHREVYFRESLQTDGPGNTMDQGAGLRHSSTVVALKEVPSVLLMGSE